MTLGEQNFNRQRPSGRVIDTAVNSVETVGDFLLARSFDTLVDTNPALGQIWARVEGLTRLSKRGVGNKSTSKITLGAGIALHIIQEQMGKERMSQIEVSQDDLNRAEDTGFLLFLPDELKPQKKERYLEPVLTDEEIVQRMPTLEDTFFVAQAGPETQAKTIALYKEALKSFNPLVADVMDRYISKRQLTSSQKGDLLLGSFEVVNILYHNSTYQQLTQMSLNG